MYTNYKSNFLEELVEMSKDERRIKVLCISGVTLHRIFGSNLEPDMIITKKMLSQLSAHQLQQDFPVAIKMARDSTNLMSVEGTLNELASILTAVAKPCIDTLEEINVDYCDEIDKAKTSAIVNQGSLPHYLEIQHQAKFDRLVERNAYFQITQFKVKNGKSFTMPVKTLMLFVHNEEFSLDTAQRPALVDFAISNCTTWDDIQKLKKEKKLPPIIQGLSKWNEDESRLASP